MDLISYNKAKKAEELAKQIVNGEVDTGVLRTKIDEKLNALETQYAPDLTEVKSGLAQTVKQGDPISVGQIDKNTGKFDQTYMADEFLQQIAGNAPVNAVPADGGITTVKLADKAVTLEKLTGDIADVVSPKRVILQNLWDINSSVLGTLNETSGVLVDHATNRTSDFIPIEPSQQYTFKNISSLKLVFFDANKTVAQGYTWISGGTHTYTSPANAKYMRFSLQQSDHSTFIINVGSEVMNPTDEGKVLSDSYWDKVPDGSVRTRHLSKEISETFQEKRVEQPYPKQLRFKEISTGWHEVNHLSRDGEVVYFKFGRNVVQSLDDGDTMQTVCTMPEGIPSVQAIRDLEDGELLISTTLDEATNLKSKVFKTVGYDRYNPENTQVVEVLEALSSTANIYSSWGLEAHDNICIASEYGKWDETGARHVYLSTDYGETWNMIFDQKVTTASIAGAPTWTTTAHLHTVHYDRYWNRIWLVVGDRPNTATYYSDDLGQTWNHVPKSDAVQYTGIISYPEGVIFGSDAPPNGLHVWKRTKNKTDPVIIETLKTINDDTLITHVFQRAYRRYAEKGEVALISATRIADFQGVYSSVIMGVTGIDNPFVLYELDKNSPSLGFYSAVGVTSRGNILTSYNKNDGTGHVVLRAKAPVWE